LDSVKFKPVELWSFQPVWRLEPACSRDHRNISAWERGVTFRLRKTSEKKVSAGRATA